MIGPRHFQIKDRIRQQKPRQNAAVFVFGALVFPMMAGCAAIYGWNIHAPGLMSGEFARDIPPYAARVGLYIPEDQSAFISKDKGTRMSDPQTYYVGESFVPMLVEAFQTGFEEFVLFETVPIPAMMTQYGVDYLAVVKITGFRNRKKYREQGLDVQTETTVFKPDLHLLARYETTGASDAPGTFAKRGGPEVNLNHAIESNLRSVVIYLQDLMTQVKTGASPV
ncbi:MAG: hypothetical protein A2Z83_03760 [Omnitrophica bacterium GWA2_52_8]|nr:MAG: hypothetical protein A2Z83_03760 [Omnitrophica bacterium GWA2_52_8]